MGKRQNEFEHVVLPHAAALLRFARRQCGDARDAEDLVQEALLKAWRAFDRLPEVSSVRAWLFQVLLNTWYSEGRRRRARPVEVRVDVDAPVLSPFDDRAVVLQALSRLPDEQREVLLLVLVEGFTCRETAEILSKPVGTVMSRLSRARAALRELGAVAEMERK